MILPGIKGIRAIILRFCILIAILFLTVPLFAKETQKTTSPTLGKISFLTSANQAAEIDFINGVLLLHNFEYERARALFRRAEIADPNFALAYWGDAMTYNQPLWNQQDLNGATKVLDKLAPTEAQRLEKAKTDREKGFIKALNLLFGKGNKTERDTAYADAMYELYHKYPNDDEIAAFYALSLLGKTEGNRDFQTYMQAAAIVEEILQHNPKHPGALHYAIHSYDDPIHAPLGLRAARVYAKVAANASHALHMPSHIYLALGMWDDVIASNKAAWEAGLKNNVDGNPKNFMIHDFHALEWLVYGHLQKKHYQEAYHLVKTMQKIAEKSNAPIAKFHYALMRADYISESKDWNTDLRSLDMNGMEPASYASNVYTNALIALHKGDNNTIEAQKLELEKVSKIVPSTATNIDYFTLATPTGILIAKITNLELQAEIKLQKKEFEEAIKILKQATELEDQLRIGYGPPVPIKPSHELLADVLLQNKQYEKAYEEYIKELKLEPNRTFSKEGLKLATEKIKDQGLSVPKGINPYFNKLMIEN